MSKEGVIKLEPGQENNTEEALKSLKKMEEDQGAQTLANYIYNKGHILNQTAVGELLGDNSEEDLLQKYADQFTFINKAGVFDTEHFFNEMKNFFDNLKLPETGFPRANIIRAFAKKYYKDNKNDRIIPSSEALINLADGVFTLNDNFNNPGKKMTEKEFVDSFKTRQTTAYFPKNFGEKILKKIYAQVKAKPIPLKIDDMIDSMKVKINPENIIPEYSNLLDWNTNNDAYNILKERMAAVDQARRDPVALKNALNFLKLGMDGIQGKKTFSKDTTLNMTIRALRKDIDLLISENNKRIRIDDRILGLKEIIAKGYAELENADDQSSRGLYLPSIKKKNAIVEDLHILVNLLDKAKQDPYALQHALSGLETYIQKKLDRGLEKKDQSILKKTFQKLRTEIAPIIHENDRKIEILEKKQAQTKKKK